MRVELVSLFHLGRKPLITNENRDARVARSVARLARCCGVPREPQGWLYVAFEPRMSCRRARKFAGFRDNGAGQSLPVDRFRKLDARRYVRKAWPRTHSADCGP